MITQTAKKFVSALAALVMAALLATTLATSAQAWLAPGPITQYPNEGGVWKYGFWDVKVRSYYTVNQCHGSTVVYNGATVRSVDTASGQTSSADKWAYNASWNDDQYYYRTC